MHREEEHTTIQMDDDREDRFDSLNLVSNRKWHFICAFITGCNCFMYVILQYCSRNQILFNDLLSCSCTGLVYLMLSGTIYSVLSLVIINVISHSCFNFVFVYTLFNSIMLFVNVYIGQPALISNITNLIHDIL